MKRKRKFFCGGGEIVMISPRGGYVGYGLVWVWYGCSKPPKTIYLFLLLRGKGSKEFSFSNKADI